ALPLTSSKAAAESTARKEDDCTVIANSCRTCPKGRVWPRAEVAWQLIVDGSSVPSAFHRRGGWALRARPPNHQSTSAYAEFSAASAERSDCDRRHNVGVAAIT